jgi:capsular polysaccharide biosynthesis protein
MDTGDSVNNYMWFKESFLFFIKRWKYIVLGLLVGAIGSFLFVTFVSPAEYQATASIHIANLPIPKGELTYQEVQNLQLSSNSIRSILGEKWARNSVSEMLGGEILADDLSQIVTIAPTTDSNILSIIVKYENSDRAVAICEAYQNTAMLIQKNYKTLIKIELAENVVISEVSNHKYIALGGLSGIMVALFCIYFALILHDRKRERT